MSTQTTLEPALRTAFHPRRPVVLHKRRHVLPSPPADAETRVYVDRQLGVLLIASVLSLTCLSVSQVHLIHLRGWLWFLVPFLVFTLGYYLISLRVNLTSHNFDITTHRTLVAAWTPASYPTVDVWLPVCGEDLELLSNTWKHVARMRRRYPGSVTVYVLDDGDDAEAAELARSLGFTYIVRPDRGRLKKAGNLRNAYRNSEGEYIVILDADFTPRDDFLLQTLPYMHHDPSLGILQTPQYFRQSAAQTLMERGAGAVQELFYRVVQVSRDLLDGAICVGSCGVYRRTALDSIGGTTQIEHSEDVHTGFDLRCAGWRLHYIPVPLATGVCPQEPDAFFTQQYRWCAGSMSLLASAKFWRAKMPFSTRLCYLSGFCYYIHTAIATFLVPLIPIVLLAFLPEQIQLRNYLWIAPSAAYTLVIFPMWNRARYGPSAMMAKSLYGWSHWFAIIDILRKRRLGWHTTGATGRRPTRRIWVSMATWGGVTIAAWTGLCVYRMLTMTPVNFVFLMIMALAYGTTCVALPFVARAQGRRRLAT